MNKTLKVLVTVNALLCQLLPGSEAVGQVYKPDISNVEVEILSPVSRGKQNYQGLSAAEFAMVTKGVTKARFSFPIKIPVDLCSREDLGLFLGVIYDQDRVFFNGELIGITADPENVSLRKTAKPRLYLVPKKLRNCRGDNIVAIEAKSLVGRRLGPFGGNIMLGAWWELEQKSDMMQEYLLLFREIGFLILAISLVLMALFEKYSQNQLQIAFVSFSFWAGLMCVSLSGWLFTFTNHPKILYQVHTVLVCVMLVEFVRMLALYTRTPYMSGLSHWWSGLGSAAVFYVLFLSTGWVALIPFYKLILLGFISLAALLFVSGLARKSFAGSGLQRILLFMILIGVASDTARIWGVHSGPNISAYLIGVSILGIGLSLASDLVAVFKMADDARRLQQEKNRQEIFNDIAHQVAHDIRSPLSALDAALKNTEQMPEEQRIMVRHAVNRIRDIATNLIEKSRQRLGADPVSGNAAGGRQDLGEPLQTCLLSNLVDPVVTEKRLQFKSRPGINIDFELTVRSYGLFAKIQPVEFQRLVSNLINNAVEALGEKGAVNLWLNSENGNVVFTISDNGKGVAPEILARLGQKGETHGKVGGSGLGLFHAKTAAVNWGGSLEMASEPGKGTTVKIKLPSAEVPEDFMLELPLAAGWPVVVLDDDASIHQVWKGRFESVRVKERGIEVSHFREPDQLRAWVKDNPEKARNTLYLFDYELLGFKETGLSLARELNIASEVVLVTSRYEEKQVIEECRRLKIRLLPKGLSGFVPISIQSPLKNAAAVLVDDDALVHMTWKVAAKTKGIDLKVFKTPADFFANIDAFPKNTPIYIDSELGNGLKGEEIAKTIHEKGFETIYLETGHPPGSFAKVPWIKDVLSKDPPWAA